VLGVFKVACQNMDEFPLAEMQVYEAKSRGACLQMRAADNMPG